MASYHRHWLWSPNGWGPNNPWGLIHRTCHGRFLPSQPTRIWSRNHALFLPHSTHVLPASLTMPSPSFLFLANLLFPKWKHQACSKLHRRYLLLSVRCCRILVLSHQRSCVFYSFRFVLHLILALYLPIQGMASYHRHWLWSPNGWGPIHRTCHARFLPSQRQWHLSRSPHWLGSGYNQLQKSNRHCCFPADWNNITFASFVYLNQLRQCDFWLWLLTRAMQRFPYCP